MTGARNGFAEGLWPLLAAACVVAATGCTTVSTATVKEQREHGITREYERPPGEVYQAAVLAMESLRSDPNWRDLEITEKDPATGTVIAMRDLDSALIPGLGERDGIGMFVADASGGDSSVTVVRLSSDQFPGSAGTTVNTARDASGLLFPAIDAALATIPAAPRTRTATAAPAPAPAAAPAATARTAAPVTAPVLSAPAASAAPRAETTIDRLYTLLRDAGTWRPLTRQLATDGSEEIRVGTWAVLTANGDRVSLRVKNKGSAVDAARLALELQSAGFVVDVSDAGGR